MDDNRVLINRRNNLIISIGLSFIILLIILGILKFDISDEDNFPKKDGILILNSLTLDEAIKKYEKIAILINTPWCDECKDIYDDISSALENETMKNLSIKFGKLDIPINFESVKKYRKFINPTILYYENRTKNETYNIYS